MIKRRISGFMAFVMVAVLFAGNVPTYSASRKTVTVDTELQLWSAMEDSGVSKIIFKPDYEKNKAERETHWDDYPDYDPDDYEPDEDDPDYVNEYDTKDAQSYLIPKVDGSENKELEIIAPYGWFQNNALFKHITVTDANFFEECVSGNVILSTADKIEFVVDGNCTVKELTLEGQKSEVTGGIASRDRGSKIESVICNRDWARVFVYLGDEFETDITLLKKTELIVDNQNDKKTTKISAKAEGCFVQAGGKVELTAYEDTAVYLYECNQWYNGYDSIIKKASAGVNVPIAYDRDGDDSVFGLYGWYVLTVDGGYVEFERAEFFKLAGDENSGASETEYPDVEEEEEEEEEEVSDTETELEYDNYEDWLKWMGYGDDEDEEEDDELPPVTEPDVIVTSVGGVLDPSFKVEINEENFPDEVFRYYVAAHFDTNSDEILSGDEIRNVTEINIDGLRFEKGLKGIGYFEGVTRLSCRDCELAKLNISNLVNLEEVDCTNNKLESLDLSKQKGLRWLSCGLNPLKKLNLKGLNNLEGIDCFRTDLEKLNLSKLPNLKSITCKESKLTSVKLSKLPSLELLDCTACEISKLDLSGLPSLTTLEIPGNKITSIDLSKMLSLQDVNLAANQLEKLELSGHKNLRTLNLAENRLKELKLSNLQSLRELYCPFNELTEFNLADLKSLEIMNCQDNKIKKLSLSKLPSLALLWCDNNELTTVDLSKLTHLTGVSFEGNKLTKLDLSGLSELQDINLAGNSIPEIDISDCDWEINCYVDETTKVIGTENKSGDLEIKSPETILYTIDEATFPDLNLRNYVVRKIDKNMDWKLSKEEINTTVWLDLENRSISDLTGLEVFAELEGLNLARNSLSKVDLSPFKKLSAFSCAANESIKKLDFSGLNELAYIDCRNTGIKKLDVSALPNLTVLYCDNTQLTELDIAKNKTLKNLSCQDLKLKNLDVVADLTELQAIDCSGCGLKKLDVSKLTNLVNLDCSDNQLKELNISACKELWNLNCNNNQLEKLDLSACKDLKSLACSGNRIKELSIKDKPDLTEVYCQENEMTKITIKNVPSLEKLYLSNNKLKELSLPALPKLTYLGASLNELTSFKSSDMHALKSLYLRGNKLQKLDLSQMTALEHLDCAFNELTKIVFPEDNVTLQNAYCQCNELKEIDITSLHALHLLSIHDTKIKQVDASRCSRTFTLSGSGSEVTVRRYGEPPLSGTGEDKKPAPVVTEQTVLKEEKYPEAYKALYDAIEKREKKVDLSKYSLSDLELYALFYRVIEGNPQFYDALYSSWSNGIVTIYYDKGDKDRKKFDSAVNEILGGIDPVWTDVQKIIYIHDYLVTHVVYAWEEGYERIRPDEKANTAYHALVEGRAVCDGYSKAFKYLMDLIGIECDKVNSIQLKHSWNVLKLDGSIYFVDVTWDDPESCQGLYCEHKNLLVDKNKLITNGHTSTDWIGASSRCDLYNDIETSKYYNSAFFTECYFEIPFMGTKTAFVGDDSFFIYDFETDETKMYDCMRDWWRGWDADQSTRYQRDYTSIAAVNGSFYYTLSNGWIVRFVEDGEDETVYGMTQEERNNGIIYGISSDGNTLIYNVRKAINEPIYKVGRFKVR